MSTAPSSSTSQRDQQPPTSIHGKPLGRQISLLDQTKSPKASVDPLDDDASDFDTELATPSGSSAPLIRRYTSQSLNPKHHLRQRKFNRYRNHIGPHDPDPVPVDGSSDAPQQGRYKRGKKKVKSLLKKGVTRLTLEEDAVIDVLYENQRGSFFFGIPLFSSKALGNLDPKSWLNGHKRPVCVDIRNAQVPDPNWEWAWPSWYVDMSRDVDEEGWEYSFSFQNGFAWHGNHPWFHSFVRRRRWLRKRIRKQAHHAAGKTASAKHMAEAHQFNSDYFTIHSERAESIGSSRSMTSSGFDRLTAHLEEEIPDVEDLRDMEQLLHYLRKAESDREKFVLVRTFIENDNAEVHYLAEEMPRIMSFFVFQDARRQLLAILSDRFDAVTKHREEHRERGEAEGAEEKRRIDNLLKAMTAADEQVKKLDYWSDVRDIAREGQTSAPEGWTVQNWQGIDSSGPGMNKGLTAKEPGKSKQELEEDAQIHSDPDSSGDITPRPTDSPKNLELKVPDADINVQGSSEDTFDTALSDDEEQTGSPDTLKAQDEGPPLDSEDEGFPLDPVDDGSLSSASASLRSEDFVTPDEEPSRITKGKGRVWE